MSGVLGTARQDGDWLMLREGFKHGFSEDQWSAAKEEARQGHDRCSAVEERDRVQRPL